jgi:hypothetical protein
MPAKRSRSSRGRSPDAYSAFVNIAYGEKFERLYLAFIAGLSGFGLITRAALEIPGSQRRLNRILDLMRRCRYSFHDLSCVELDPKRPQTPRFNIPFELGLAVALATVGGHVHKWHVFESKRYRGSKSLSDLNGTEIYIHDGRPIGVLRELTNALVRPGRQPSVNELRAIYRELSRYSRRLKKELATKSLFATRPFRQLVVAAGSIAQKQALARPRSLITQSRP